MKAIVDCGLCIACGLCENVCPEVFKLEGDCAQVIADPVPADAEGQAVQATGDCPTTAIKIEG